jgi:hypothetical protein
LHGSLPELLLLFAELLKGLLLSKVFGRRGERPVPLHPSSVGCLYIFDRRFIAFVGTGLVPEFVNHCAGHLANGRHLLANAKAVQRRHGLYESHGYLRFRVEVHKSQAPTARAINIGALPPSPAFNISGAGTLSGTSSGPSPVITRGIGDGDGGVVGGGGNTGTSTGGGCATRNSGIGATRDHVVGSNRRTVNAAAPR